MLTFAAKNADIVGVNPSLPSSAQRAAAAPDALPERIDEKFAWIREAAGPRSMGSSSTPGCGSPT